MEIPPKYKLTREMLELCSQIEAKKALLENFPKSSRFIENLQRVSLLKSSLFSAKIEGNTLELHDIEDLNRVDPDLKERVEVENILSAFSFIRNSTKEIDADYILDIHGIVMKGLGSSGRFRSEPSAIYNQSGFPVYIPPSPLEIKKLMEKLIMYIKDEKKENVLIKAALTHYCFEKIHPFLDGNGRVGRLLVQVILAKANYHFDWLLTIEEGINGKKEEYYAYLDKDDVTSFIEFILEVILNSADKALKNIFSATENKEEELLPRRKEILDILRDHKVVSLDFIRRRFLEVSPRSLRYDLKDLEKQGYIVKAGVTRGTVYKIKETL